MPQEVTVRRYDDDEISLLDYWQVIRERRRLIGVLSASSLLIALLYSLLTPKLYEATATMLPPKESAFGGNQISLSMGAQLGEGSLDSLLLGQLGSSGLFNLRTPTPSRDAYTAILKSRTMREEVAEHFKKKWGPSMASRIGKTTILVAKDGVVSISVSSPDPKLSAEVANFYFENLSTTLARRAENMMKQQMDYYNRQLDDTHRDLKKAQTTLIEFQEKNRYISLDPATKTAIEFGAMQAGGVMALEMERNVKRMYLTDNHPEMVALSRRIYEAKRIMSHQLYGEPQELPPEKPGAPARKEFFVAKAKMTPVQFELVEVYRNLKFREAMWSYINHNLQALNYTKENPAAVHVDWLDRAIPPGEPYWPNILYNLAAAAIGSLVVGTFVVLFLKYLDRVKALNVSAR